MTEHRKFLRYAAKLRRRIRKAGEYPFRMDANRPLEDYCYVLVCQLGHIEEGL